MVLRIKGDVIPTPGKLRQKIGLLKSSLSRIDFGDIFFPQEAMQNIEIENSKNTNVKPTVTNCPEYVNLKIYPETLTPGERGNIEVTFNSKLKQTFGKSKDAIKLNMTFGTQNSQGAFVIQANVKEDFSKLTEQELVDAPSIFFLNKVINIGKLEEKQMMSYKFEYENQGKSPLIIRNIDMNNTAFNIAEYDAHTNSGEMGKLILKTNPTYKSSTVATKINVISNDPKQSSITLQILGSRKITEPVVRKSSKFSANMKDIKVFEANKLLEQYKNSGKLVILDVRTAKEFEISSLPEAINLNIEDKNFYRTIELLDRSKLYLVYCKSGIRSEKAITIMNKLGFKNLMHMIEGMDGWEKNGLEVIKPSMK